MIQWLYRYIFRGIGLLFVVGMITIFFLAVSSQMHHYAKKSTTIPVGARR